MDQIKALEGFGGDRAAARQAAATLLSHELIIRAIARQTNAPPNFHSYKDSDWQQFHEALAKHVNQLADQILGTTPNHHD